MSEANPGKDRRGPDLLAVVLLGLLGLAAIGAAFAIVAKGYMTAGGLAALLVVGGAFVAVHAMGGRAAPPKNSQVHGAARPASEHEARRAGGGQSRGARLDDREF
jgi:peptidoglycan/LPS O-acetylase OafA/YrhL